MSIIKDVEADLDKQIEEYAKQIEGNRTMIKQEVEYDVHMDMTENEERLRINFKVVNPAPEDVERIGLDMEKMRVSFLPDYAEDDEEEDKDGEYGLFKNGVRRWMKVGEDNRQAIHIGEYDPIDLSEYTPWALTDFLKKKNKTLMEQIALIKHKVPLICRPDTLETADEVIKDRERLEIMCKEQIA